LDQQLATAAAAGVNAQAAAYYNVVRPDLAGDWQLRAQVQVLLPK
jgi:hypothetical protein